MSTSIVFVYAVDMVVWSMWVEDGPMEGGSAFCSVREGSTPYAAPPSNLVRNYIYALLTFTTSMRLAPQLH
ncbi:hypothetical protein [Shewanella violacea]|uniref:hypothetical protein n=1 Tax=Shewanella violacea TaxID=60217 RepID=UPI0012FC66C8|nr:hypothetical protein [Shewanella violacea]